MMKIKELAKEQEQYVLEHTPKYTQVSLDLWGLGQADPQIKAHYAEGYAIWRGRIEKTIAEDLPEVAPEKRTIAASMLISMVLGAQIQYMSDKTVFDLDVYMDHCLNAVLTFLGCFEE